MQQNLITKEFIKKAKAVHGNKYDYSKVRYKNSRTKVSIICLQHGKFEQTPNNHLNGNNCPKCANNSRSKLLTKSLEKFIKKAKQIHKDKYDYSKVNYINCDTKIIITCPIHGEFEQTPDVHLRNKGCPKCGYDMLANLNRKTTEEFIEEAIQIHGNKYDYSKVNYTTADKKVIIICPIHGEFKQTPSGHLSKRGCRKCSKKYQPTTEEYIETAKQTHKDKYEYSKVNYVTCDTKIIIICPAHGEFLQRASSHVNGNGCPQCNNSKGERTLQELFKIHEIDIKREYRYTDLIGTGGGELRFDFAIIKNSKLIFLLEYQGIQHFKPWGNTEELIKTSEQTQYHDKLKLKYCETNNIPLEFINYNQDIEERFNYLMDKYTLKPEGLK